MRYVLDTNVLIAYLRKQPVWYQIEETFGLFDAANEIMLPSIIIGELRSLGIQNNWGERRKAEMEELIKQFVSLYALAEDAINRYAEIDAFSQGRLPGRRLESSARNMGKNDLWIAAMASTLNATLITTDKDFDHLHSHFLSVARFDLN